MTALDAHEGSDLDPPGATAAFHNGRRGRFNAWFFTAFDRYIGHITRPHKRHAFGDISSGTIVEIGAGCRGELRSSAGREPPDRSRTEPRNARRIASAGPANVVSTSKSSPTTPTPCRLPMARSTMSSARWCCARSPNLMSCSARSDACSVPAVGSDSSSTSQHRGGALGAGCNTPFARRGAGSTRDATPAATPPRRSGQPASPKWRSTADGSGTHCSSPSIPPSTASPSTDPSSATQREAPKGQIT